MDSSTYWCYQKRRWIRRPAAGQLQQGHKAAGVVIGTRGIERAVVMSTHQQGAALGLPAGQAQDQVSAPIAAAAKSVFLQRPQSAQPLAQCIAHAHQAQRIPAGMARYRELLKIGEQASLESGIGDRHGAMA